jgi:LysM repeat protein
MLKYICSTIVLVFFLTNSFGTPLDSLGIEKKNGKILVQHKIEKGETLYSILKRYDCSEKDFFAANNTLKQGDIIPSDQVIEVPYKSKKNVAKAPIVEIITPTENRVKGKIDENGIEIVDIPEATPKESPKEESKIDYSKSSDLVKKDSPKTIPLKEKNHTVLAGQNLFSISKLYNLKVWQLREWNELKSDALQVNQVLLVEKPANFVAKTTKKDTLKAKIQQVQAPAGDISTEKTSTTTTKPITTTPPTTVPNAPGGKKFNEIGIAEVIDAGSSTNKYLALHRTAPIGTLIKVANQANGQSVWVKVIGKFNGSGDVVIKVSPKAFEKLSPRDKRIRAELSYSVSN